MAESIARPGLIVEPDRLGWLGTGRQVSVLGMSERFCAAVTQRAAELGLDIAGIAPEAPCFLIETGTPETWLAADKLCAYIDGLSDGVTDVYGNAPVEVGRKDLQLLIALSERGFEPLHPQSRAAIGRLREALDD